MQAHPADPRAEGAEGAKGAKGAEGAGGGGRGGAFLTLTAVPATADETARWDDLVAAAEAPHLLQTTGWAALKGATGWEARRYLLRDGARVAGLCQVLLRRLPLGVSVAYAARGPLVAAGDLPAALVALRAVLRGERGACLLADPEVAEDALLRASLDDAGVLRSPVYVQPRRTLLVDLGPEPADLLAAMRKKTRQYVRKAEREGVLTEETTDLARFLAVLDRVAARDRFALHDPAYFARLREVFGDRAHLFVARVGGDDAGALLVVRFAGRAWELFGGWSGTQAEHRPFYLLKWRALLRMRALGVRRYDMWGLDEDGSLAGVESFKRGFGGDEATWLGMLETPVVPLLWPVWRFAGRRRLARAGQA